MYSLQEIGTGRSVLDFCQGVTRVRAIFHLRCVSPAAVPQQNRLTSRGHSDSLEPSRELGQSWSNLTGYAHNVHAPSRMRGSAVVQGLKSFASRLHPQLPLAPKESQKLLVALTTAFQNELDQAHPRQADDGTSPPSFQQSSDASSGSRSQRTSSVTLADRHLASILTNPLLAPKSTVKKPMLDIDTARAALEHDPDLDPISLLEDYHEKGAATAHIAALCLNAHDQKTRALPEGERQAFLAKIKAGKRTLLWVWRSKIYEDPSFFEDGVPRLLHDHIYCALAREGEEEFLWDCLRTDQAPIGRDPAWPGHWRRTIVRQIVHARLLQAGLKSANSALDAIFRAHELSRELKHKGKILRLDGSAIRLKEFWSKYPLLVAGTDPARYDKFLEMLPDIYRTRADLLLLYIECCLLHPRSPNPLPAFELLKRTCYPDQFHPSQAEREALEIFKNPRTEARGCALSQVLATVAKELRKLRREEDAVWVESVQKDLYGSRVRTTDRHVQLDRFTAGAKQEPDEFEDENDENIPLPSPT